MSQISSNEFNWNGEYDMNIDLLKPSNVVPNLVHICNDSAICHRKYRVQENAPLQILQSSRKFGPEWLAVKYLDRDNKKKKWVNYTGYMRTNSSNLLRLHRQDL